MPVAALDAAAAATTSDGDCELADVLRRYGEDFAHTHALRSAQYKAIRAITACRTAALGGHRQWCERCGYQRYVYHSCRNRHCPQCQSTTQAAWVKARQDELLPVPYFHNVFTLPHELGALVLYSERNQRALLKLFFDATAQTLLEFGRQEFSGKVGFTLLLHTWDQQLRPHFHVHCLIASGALSADGSRWIAGGREFLFPVRGLSKMFRAKYLDGLAGLLEKNQLDLPPQLVQLGDPTRRTRWLRPLRKKPWVVYSQRPFAGPRKLLDYLGRGKTERLTQVRRLLGARRFVKQEDEQPHTAADWMRLLLGIEIDRCPCCGEVLQRESLPPTVSRLLASPCLPAARDPPVRGPPARDVLLSGAST